MKDQYGEDIPNDLVLMPSIESLNEEELKIVDNANWYEQNKVLMVSAKEINYLSEDDILNADITLKEDKIFYIAFILHRFDENGFYHA
jgi:hypothetical protein